MDLNATLIVQSITFLVFVTLMWRFAWPPIVGAMQARQAKIAEGLSAADRATKALTDANARSDEALKQARIQAQEILAAANKQAAQLVEAAKTTAQTEADRIKASSRDEVDRAVNQARETLRKQVGELAVSGAAQILKREINAQAHADVLKDLAAKI